MPDAATNKGVRAPVAAPVTKFITEAGVCATDGVARRGAAKFARLHTAGRLACDWGVPPLRNIGPDILAVYHRAEALRLSAPGAHKTPFERIKACIREHGSVIADLNEGTLSCRIGR